LKPDSDPILSEFTRPKVDLVRLEDDAPERAIHFLHGVVDGDLNASLPPLGMVD
jgi:hypothetical protein